MKIIIRCFNFVLMVAVIFAFTSSSTIYVQSIENTTMNKTVNLSTMATMIAESEYVQLHTPLESFSGDLTSYVYNCELCTGRLACMSNLDLSDGTTTYVDADYGEVYIVASSRDLPCGSIVSFESRLDEDTMYAIVLDRGVLGNDLDLLVWGLEYAYQVGRIGITYNVLRSGW
ncbi:MAG: hypothetical protein R3Y13_03690 [bacterium]